MLGMVKFVTSFKEVGLESCRNSLKGKKKTRIEWKRDEIQLVLKKINYITKQSLSGKILIKFNLIIFGLTP